MIDDELPPPFPKTERLKQQRRLPLWALIALQVTGLLLVAMVLSWWLVHQHRQAAPPPSQPPSPAVASPTVMLPTLTVPQAGAPVVAPTPVPPTSLPPTATPIPPTPTVQPPPPDPGDDLALLVGGAAVTDAPAGVDIVGCNIEKDATLRLEVPPPLGGSEGTRLRLWMTLASPVPEERALDYHFLVALDADGSQASGRPVGSGYINPDIGEDVGAGYILHPDGSADLYLYIWDPGIGGWQEIEQPETIVHPVMSDDRMAFLFDFDREQLAQAIASVVGFTPDFTAARGRVGIIASSQTAAAIVDFCPNRP